MSDPRTALVGAGYDAMADTREAWSSELAERCTLTVVHGDLTTIAFDEASLDGVCAFYVLNHVPRELLPGLFERVRTWLRPGGARR